MDTATVRAVNALTARWAGVAVTPGNGTAFSAVGVWPLLAFLGGAADGPARAELEQALGVPADQAVEHGRALLEALGAADGIDTALGVWTKREVPLREEWVERLPLGVAGRLTGDAAVDRKELDAWAARNTHGLIEEMPVELDASTLMVLASALCVQTQWQQPFTPRTLEPKRGPWAERKVAGLSRSGSDLGLLGVAATPAGALTVLDVQGANGIDVRLLLGEETAGAGDVLRAGTEVLAGAYEVVPGGRLAEGLPGPGVAIQKITSFSSDPQLYTTTAAFTVSDDHDLLQRAELFGLGAARDTGRGHFPGVSEVPLAVAAARQSITASFSAEGFVAAAVTAFSMVAGGAPQKKAKFVAVTFDRPFGFLAVHRASGLVLTAGWVTDPHDAVIDERWGGGGW
ncbi:serpin family protein [Streptomyces sp. RKAG337]|uniref:serpin family protein n=1 Tax=Streptomyces sp. RKAG337 TaxID=2893404 RepID=UPI0020341855|nr:serpin family protein [Streptomyces sp. RKAG337]MCM2425238.1 serpin family protein [Streptomyces sp. RKAG337]